MREILFISHRIPFPPDRGDKIRSYHVLKRLARLAPVHVATFADDDFDMAEEVELAALARSYRLLRRAKPLFIAGLQALATRTPVCLTAFHDPVLAAYVDELLASHPISTIYVYSGQMGQYVPDSFEGKLVVDFVDVDSAKFEAYAARRSGLLGWIQAREGRMLRDEEARLSARADASLLITEAEARLFRSRLSPEELARADIRVMGNGIDPVVFDPATVAPEPRMLDCPGPRLIFTGQMDYAPNVDAVWRVIRRILPLVREQLHKATFHIVGRNPSQALLDCHGKDGCHVWGRVNDIRPWLKAGDLALVPLDIARGVQNKVLEAMAMSLPVVLTSGAATGIEAKDGEHFAIADSDEGLAAAAVALLRDHRQGRAMGNAARQHVSRTVSWQAALEPLAGLVGLRASPLHDAA